MNEKDILASVLRPGWKVTGRRPDTHSVSVPIEVNGQVLPGQFRTEEQPTGNEVWDIASTDGKQVDSITVKPPAVRVGAGTTDADAAYAGSGYSVVKGPTKEVPADARATPTSAAGLETITDPTTGKPIKLRDPATGTVIDLPATAADQRPQIVSGPGGAVYAWDGTKLTPLLAGEGKQPQIIQGQRGAMYSWDGKSLTTIQGPEAKDPDIRLIDAGSGGKQLVRINPDGSFAVLHTFPAGLDVRTTQDGSIIAIDPANPTAPPQTIWTPSKPKSLIPGQSPTQGQFIQQDPATGALSAVPNPLGGATTQRMQEYMDGINAIQGMLTRGEIDLPTATKYKDALRQNFDAALQGTTPYQQYQDQQARTQARMQSGASLLNQRVQSGSGLAQSLVSSALGIVGNKNFMDPSAVMGFSPFAGAADYVTSLGGGPDVYTAAANAVKSGMHDSPADALLAAALGPRAGSQPQPSPAAAPLAAGPQAALPAQQSAPPPDRSSNAADDEWGRRGGSVPPLGQTNDVASALLQAALGGDPRYQRAT